MSENGHFSQNSPPSAVCSMAKNVQKCEKIEFSHFELWPSKTYPGYPKHTYSGQFWAPSVVWADFRPSPTPPVPPRRAPRVTFPMVAKIHFAEILGSWVWVGFFWTLSHWLSRHDTTSRIMQRPVRISEIRRIGWFLTISWPQNWSKNGSQMVSKFRKKCSKKGSFEGFLAPAPQEIMGGGIWGIFFLRTQSARMTSELLLRTCHPVPWKLIFRK